MVCQLPLFDSGPNRAPWMRNQAPTRFPRVDFQFYAILIASHRLARHLTVPVALCELHSLASDSLRPCEFGRVLGLHATPVSFWPSQRPLVTLPGFCFFSFWSARLSVDFRHFPSRRFHLADPRRFADFTTPLSIRFGRCRPTACWVCTPPLSLSVGQNPLAANYPRQDPAVALISEPFA